MQKEINDKEYKHKTEIKELQDGLEALRKINTVCEECDGEGKYLRSRACAEDDRPDPSNPRDYRTCTKCGGSGRAKYN